MVKRVDAYRGMNDQKVMFDTNIFNYILDGKISIRKSSDVKYFLANVLPDELNACRG